MQALIDAQPIHNVGGGVFEHAGANSPQNMILALSLDNDGVDIRLP
jgi:hypothetical protein